MLFHPEPLEGSVPEGHVPYPPLLKDIDIWGSINCLEEQLDLFIHLWREASLVATLPHPSDPDEYAGPVIQVAELLRRRGLISINTALYCRALEEITAFESKFGVKLHRGAINANLAISHLQAGRYDLGVIWLHAAAQEDLTNLGITDPLDSYALREFGIYGQFLDRYVLRLLPNSISIFISDHLGASLTNSDFMYLYRWLAGSGDINLISSVLEFNAVSMYSDPHSDSVRFICLRNLATLFEILWKRIGSLHLDPMVRVRFVSPPTFAGLICHMHFQDSRSKRRHDPTLNSRKTVGLLWNSIAQSPILQEIDRAIDYCAGDQHSLTDVWNYLQTGATSVPTQTPTAIAVSQRFLLAYKMRNITSHEFCPQDNAIKLHHTDMHEWLLQSIFYLFFWAKLTHQAGL